MDIVVLAQIFYRLWKSPLVTKIIIDILHLIVFKTINKKPITMEKGKSKLFKKRAILCIFIWRPPIILLS